MKKSPFKKALSNSSLTQILDEPVKGTGRYMGPGEYAVTIEDCDTRKLESDGKVIYTLINEQKERHRESVFIFPMEGDGLSHKFNRLISSVLPNIEAIKKYEELLVDDRYFDDALQCFRGMKVWVEIADTPGYRIQNIDGVYESYDVNNDAYLIADGKRYKDVEKETESQGIKKSYRKVLRWEAGDEQTIESNLNAIDLAYQAITDSKGADSDTDTSNVHRFKGAGSE